MEKNLYKGNVNASAENTQNNTHTQVVDIFNTDKKYNIIYADPPWKYNDKMKMRGVHGNIRRSREFLFDNEYARFIFIAY